MGDLQSAYKSALQFATRKHKGQKLPGTSMPYIIHVIEVAMEILIAAYNTPGFDTQLAVEIALLHDTMEDTKTSYKEIEDAYGPFVAEGVLALTKFSNLGKPEQMADSIKRIKEHRKEVWAVKLADRINNLGAPPLKWKKGKRIKYLEGSQNILQELGHGNKYLSERLAEKIEKYKIFVETGEKFS